MRAPSHRWGATAVVVTSVVMVASCGLPGGSAHTVDAETVPYDLLEPSSPAAPSSLPESEPAQKPVVFWIAGDRLAPEATDTICAEQTEALVEELLNILATGPSEEARAAGKSSAIPPDSGLELVGIADGTAEVDIEPETSLSAERLPVAVGQIVLTITSAPAVGSVRLVADGEPAKVPLPDGALTDGPVTAEDYVELLPDRFKTPGTFGCAGADRSTP